MSNIRVTYSGLIALAAGLTSVLTGAIFTLIVTRRLSPEDFGMWSIIGSMISYFLIAEPVISFWATRQIARGEEVGKTALTSSTIFSLGAIPIYLTLSYYVSQISHSHYNSMLIAVALLPVTFVSQTMSGINLGHKPHATSYGLLIFESLKIPVGLVLVYFLNLGIDGAIVTTVVAYIGKIGMQIYYGRDQLQGKFTLGNLRHWIKHSWLPLYSNLSHVVWSLDVLVYTIITKSVLGVAYFSVSSTIAAVIGNAGLISQAVYPKLLAKGSHNYINENFSRLMYFSIPLLGISLIFSKAALFALNPAYADAYVVVIIYSFRTFFYSITSTLYQILMAIEDIDLEKNYSFRGLAKSRLFLIPTLTNIQYGLYLGSLALVLFVMSSNVTSQVVLVSWWATIALSLQIPFLIYAFLLIRKHIKFSFPIASTTKYVVATLAFMLVFFLTSHLVINYQNSIYSFLPKVLLELFICMSVYLAVTFVIDKRTRILFKSIFGELISK